MFYIRCRPYSPIFPLLLYLSSIYIMHTSLQKLNHFVIIREDNLAPPTDASTTVCLYEFSAAKHYLKGRHFHVFKLRGCGSCYTFFFLFIFFKLCSRWNRLVPIILSVGAVVDIGLRILFLKDSLKITWTEADPSKNSARKIEEI